MITVITIAEKEQKIVALLHVVVQQVLVRALLAVMDVQEAAPRVVELNVVKLVMVFVGTMYVMVVRVFVVHNKKFK